MVRKWCLFITWVNSYILYQQNFVHEWHYLLLFQVAEPTVRALFANRNILALHQLNGGDILLEVCVSDLLNLQKYTSLLEVALTSGGDYNMPATVSEAMAVRVGWVKI